MAAFGGALSFRIVVPWAASKKTGFFSKFGLLQPSLNRKEGLFSGSPSKNPEGFFSSSRPDDLSDSVGAYSHSVVK
jgi:hypothetical protein